jgi:lipopolysaccharide/colanic/teichoic acid biosynthesis glycosyltransferase
MDQDAEGVFGRHAADAAMAGGLIGLEVAGASGGLRKRSEIVNRSFAKRAIDIVGAAGGLLLLAPLMLTIALLIKLDSRGPVFFRQLRYGAGRKPFFILKFRSMSCPEGGVPATSDDARLTRIGRLLRRTSLDELPQLINVLFGEMSLVGPRPHALAMDDAYASWIMSYADRHLVRPGLTGLAQIGGYRGPTASDAMITGRLRLDRDYIRRWSVMTDIMIIVRTPVRMMADREAF